jgi:hypothetical protein
MINPDEVKLSELTKQFEYARMSNEIDNCDNVEEIRLAAKCYVKLYLSTLEAMVSIKDI